MDDRTKFSTLGGAPKVFRETLAKLAAYSDPTEFERLCADLLVRAGYGDLIPRGPSRQDGGADATRAYFSREQVFQISLQTTWRRKLLDTAATLAQAGARSLQQNGSLVFVTNQAVPPLAADRVIATIARRHRLRVTLYDQEWLRLQLDLHQDLRATYLGISARIGFRRVPVAALAHSIAAQFALPDYVRQLFTLAVMRRAKYLELLRVYYSDIIDPWIKNPRAKFGDLLPIDLSASSAGMRDTVRVDGKTTVLYPVVEQDLDLPGLAIFYGQKADQPPVTEYRIPVTGGGYIAIARTPFIDVAMGVDLVSMYVGIQFRRLRTDAEQRLGLDHLRAERTISAVMTNLRRLLGRSWADALREHSRPMNLRWALELAWSNRSLERVLPFLLSSLGTRDLRRLLQRAHNEELEHLCGLIADDRIHHRVLQVALRVALQREVRSDLVNALRAYAERSKAIETELKRVRGARS